MQEELEEGHFDKEGMYHWKKEKDVQDNWLENIDWCKVKKTMDLIFSYIVSCYIEYCVICVVCLDKRYVKRKKKY